MLHCFIETLPESWRQLVRFAFFVKGNRLPNVVHDYLAGIATGNVLLEFTADPGVGGAIDILV